MDLLTHTFNGLGHRFPIESGGLSSVHIRTFALFYCHCCICDNGSSIGEGLSGGAVTGFLATSEHKSARDSSDKQNFLHFFSVF